MPNYAIRVELRGNPSYDEYQTLHALMARMDFRQTIDGVDLQGNQKTFNLPHAVYYGFSAADCSAVSNTVAEAVRNQVQNNIIVFVVQVGNWTIR